MDFYQILIFILSAYVIGSTPSIILISKLFYGINIRDHGDGTATHNNMAKVIGVVPTIYARILDVLKGFLASQLAIVIYGQMNGAIDYEYSILLLAMGLAAVLGHIFPIFTGFKGGKGYHVSIGVFLSLNPYAAAYSVAIALIIFWISRYPNLGHIVGGLALPAFILFTRHLYGDLLMPMTIFALILSLLLFMTYRSSIMNMLYGNEARVSSRGFKFKIRRH